MLNSLRANSPFGRVARSYARASGGLAVPSRLASPSIIGKLARRLRVELRCSESV